MLTLETLKEYGADTDAAMTRCMNNESFYLRMVDLALESDGYAALEEALNKGDLDAAFEAAHGLKGILSNLALDPMLKPAVEITELLRSRTQTDYAPLLAAIDNERERLLS